MKKIAALAFMLTLNIISFSQKQQDFCVNNELFDTINIDNGYTLDFNYWEPYVYNDTLFSVLKKSWYSTFVKIAGDSVVELNMGDEFDDTPSPNNFCIYNREMYFRVSSSSNSSYKILGKYDGSAFKKVELGQKFPKDIDPCYLTSLNGKLYFIANLLSGNIALVEYNGNIASIITLGNDFNTKSSLYCLASYKESIYFTAKDNNENYVLARYNGAICEKVDLNKTLFSSSPGPVNKIEYNDTLFFSAKNINDDFCLAWYYEGNSGIIDLGSDFSKNSYPTSFLIYNNILYFTAENNTGKTVLASFKNGRINQISTFCCEPSKLFLYKGRLFFIHTGPYINNTLTTYLSFINIDNLINVNTSCSAGGTVKTNSIQVVNNGEHIFCTSPKNGYRLDTAIYTGSGIVQIVNDSTVFLSGIKSEGTLNITFSKRTSAIAEYEDAFRLYPNPSNGLFTVTTSFEGESQLTITTLSGQRIYGPAPFTQSTQVNLAGQPKGVYLCVVKNSNQVKTSKIEIK